MLFWKSNLGTPFLKNGIPWVVVVVEWLPPTPEICSSNTVIAQFYLISTVINLFRKDENKEIEAVNGPFKWHSLD